MDCLLIVDEAHCAQPFCETVQLISEKYQSWAEAPLQRSLRLVRMSATPGELPDFTLGSDDHRHPELSRRTNAAKPAELVLVRAKDEEQRGDLVAEIVRQAERFLEKPRVVGIVVNRVADARAVFNRLNLKDGQKLLLTGRVRGWERDRLLARWLPRLRAGAREPVEMPVAVVATQCIEVGANLDFGVSALDQHLPRGNDLAVLCAPTSHAPVLLPAHVDLLAQTWPAPEPSPEVSVFLHGFASGPAEVAVVWRADLPEDEPHCWADRAAVQPPVVGESCAVPFRDARGWLTGASVDELGGDLEGRDALEENGETPRAGRRALRWRGASDTQIIRPEDLRPVLRLSPEVLSGWLQDIPQPDGVSLLRTWAMDAEEAEDLHVRAVLSALAKEATLPEELGWLRELAGRLHKETRMRPMLAAGAPALLGQSRAGRDVSTADERSALTLEVPLDAHCRGVQSWAQRLAKAVGLSKSLQADLSIAAWLHDVGKADPRFQVWLHAGDEIAAALAPQPRAKSAANARNRAAQALARVRAGYPENCRHELLSLALIQNAEEFESQANDWDLVLHLVASHHGFCRPLAPVAEDQGVDIELIHGDVRLAANSAHELHHPAQAVPDRFWRLVRKYGWWGLAWLETCLRLADHRCSEEEELLGGSDYE